MKPKNLFYTALKRLFTAIPVLMLALIANANEITSSNSLVSLGLTGTTNYTFSDAATGANVVIAVTMTPYSASDPADVFMALDGGTRLGVGNPANGGDGNWVESAEGANFSASLVSASAGVIPESVKFRIAGLGLRGFATVTWTSSAGIAIKSFGDGADNFQTLDTSASSLHGTNYSATLRLSGQLQLTDAGPLSGKGAVLSATFSTVTISAGTQVIGDPTTSAPALSSIISSNVVVAANFGGSSLARDDVAFTGITSTSNPMTNVFGNQSVRISAPTGNLNAITYGDSLFGSFIWADNQNEMSVEVSGLNSASAYNLYYLFGDSRNMAFNMFLTLTASNATDANTTVAPVSWGAGSSNAVTYTYLPAAVSNTTTLVAKMTKNGSSAGVAFSGVIVEEINPSNRAPTLTSIATLTGASEDNSFIIHYTNLLAAADAADLDGDPISFRIEAFSNWMSKSGVPVTNGVTLLSTNESLLWLPVANANGVLSACTVRAWDGELASANAVDVQVSVAALNDPPLVLTPIAAQAATYGTPFTYTFPTNTFVDIDTAELSYSFNYSEAYAFPFWLSLNSETRTFSGTPTNSGTYGGQLTAYDGAAGAYPLFEVNVAKAALTVTASSATRAVGQSNPTFTGSIVGLKNNDNISVIYTTTATTGSAAGDYPITPTLVDPNNRLTNYIVSLIDGTLTITNVPVVAVVDPRTNSWITATAGRYVRLYTNAAAQTAGVTTPTWTFSSLNGTAVTGSQTNPVYAGVQELYSSSNWVYLRASSMPATPIGPLLAYAPAALLLPYNQKSLFRVPRNPAYTSTKTLTGGGAIGYLVDGVQMFDTRDALSWTGSSEGMGTGYWTRDAYVNEGYGFDPVQGHAAPGGAYHYHSNPQGLRYMLGDHVDFNAATKVYSESTGPVTKHSPILGWLRDGYPVYGPYGYSSASNSASGIRRMLSGFVLRNGQNGTANLTTVGRTNIPPWAQRLYNVTTATGPSVASYGPLGRYLEDHDHMVDLINPSTSQPFVKGVDYDLDEHNGRWCVTPEFPNGTYAYFVTINADGTPKYPYYIGRAYFGTVSGGPVSSINETVVTNFVGGTNMPLALNTPAKNANLVTLTWSAVEGGTYRVESSTDLSTWVTNTSNATPQRDLGVYTNSAAENNKFYRVTRTAVATFDPVNSTGGTGGGTTNITMSPATGTRSTTVSVTATISGTATPTPPPSNVAVQTFTIGSLTVSNPVHTSQYQVTGSVTIPAGATLGGQTVTITFQGPGGGAGPTYTQANGFTIQ